MGAVLDVVGRPEAPSGCVVPFVEQGVECLKDKRLVLLLNRETHFSSSKSVVIVIVLTPLRSWLVATLARFSSTARWFAGRSQLAFAAVDVEFDAGDVRRLIRDE